MNRFSLAVLLFLMAIPAFGQEADSIQAIQARDSMFQFDDSGFLLHDSLMVVDTMQQEAPEAKSPTKALMFALVFPGLGQAYNGKYWKIPIVWAALGATGYFIVYNTRQYEQATINYIKDETDQNERFLKGWKRNRELSYIVAIAVYSLQVLDAYVDANLSTWDVNQNLSLGISPSLQPMMAHTSQSGYSGGLTCSIKFKGR